MSHFVKASICSQLLTYSCLSRLPPLDKKLIGSSIDHATFFLFGWVTSVDSSYPESERRHPSYLRTFCQLNRLPDCSYRNALGYDMSTWMNLWNRCYVWILRISWYKNIELVLYVNLLAHIKARWRDRTWSTLVWLMACYVMAPSHYLI